MTEQQVLQVIGQLEASIDKIEAFLDTNSFQEYCDNTYSNISYWMRNLSWSDAPGRYIYSLVF